MLAPPTNLSTDTLVEATARNYSANVEASTPSSSDVEARGPFTFSPFGPNAMLLLPHAFSSNSRPLYHISVSNDCFRPQIYTTTIRRGTEQGQVIAEFQRSILQGDGYRGTIEYRGSGQPKVAYLDEVHHDFQRGIAKICDLSGVLTRTCLSCGKQNFQEKKWFPSSALGTGEGILRFLLHSFQAKRRGSFRHWISPRRDDPISTIL